MNKKVIAVRPYRFKNGMQFLNGAFDAWVNSGGKWKNHYWQPRPLHYFFYHYNIPFRFPQNKKEARLMFIAASTLKFCTYADYVRYEIIPVLWDCWPKYNKQLFEFIRKSKVRVAVVMSQMMGDIIRKEFPNIKLLCLPEGIDISPYNEGFLLKDRTIDLLEFGRSNKNIVDIPIDSNLTHLYSKDGKWIFRTNEELYNGLANTKTSLTFPRCDTHPDFAGGIETLTQRYWECMLSRVVMIGRSPFELKELLGYNPVIEINGRNVIDIILDVKTNPDKYQMLVDKNREMALKFAPWEWRIIKIKSFLSDNGYIV